MWQNWAPCVTHVIGASTEGHRFKAMAQGGRGVLCISWLVECSKNGSLQNPKPHDYLLLPREGPDAFADVDKFGDS